MNLPRRQFLHLAAGVAALPALPRVASALDYPSRPVRWIVGFAAGGDADILARLIGQWLSEQFRQQFIIENRPGAASNIAIEAVVRAPADGYTLVSVSSTNAINATLYEGLNFNLIADIAPVAGIVRAPNVLVAYPSFPAKTVTEFIAYAKANSGTINYASAGVGSISHMSGELFKMMTGVNIQHVPYRGAAPALIDLLNGRVQVGFLPMPGSIEYIRAGKLNALAVTTARRSDQLPDIPAIGDFVAGYEASVSFGVGAPKNTPAEIVAKLNKEIDAGLADPKLKDRFADLGATALSGSSEDFGELIADETEKWGKVIRSASIKVE
jgi:tripartite-type tricarboxylate transporter receptor subunit TctC